MMKKLLKLITVLAVACTMVFGLVGTALAAGSSTDTGIITAATSDGKDVLDGITVSDIDSGIPPLTAEYAATVISGAKESELTVVWQKEVKSEILPVDLTFAVSGAADQEVYVFHYDVEKGSAEEYWGSPVANGTGTSITASFEDLSPVGIVVRSVAESTPAADDQTSPKTGETGLYLACAAVVLGGAVAVVSLKKRSAN